MPYLLFSFFHVPWCGNEKLFVWCAASGPAMSGLRCSPARSLTVLLGVCTLACGRVRPAERDALWALYQATGGADWTNKENWNLTSDPCRKHAAPVPHRTFAPEPFDETATFAATPWFGVGCIDPCDDNLDGENCTAGRVVSLKLRAVRAPRHAARARVPRARRARA